MSDIIQNVKGTNVQQTTNTKTKTSNKTTGSNELGKDAFLQLLVTQMKYQDPLNPSTDTQYIAQLATFSQLEQMQNLGTTATNSQAFSLVGKNVIMKTQTDTGNINYINGTVDYVSMQNGKAELSINGSLYPIDQLDSVIDDTFVTKQGLPGIKDSIKLEYDGTDPKDATFNVNLGSGDTVADNVAVLIDNTLISSDKVKVSGNKVTIDKSAFAGYKDGSYKMTVVFNDPLYTTVSDKITLNIKNSGVPSDGSDGSDNSGSTDNNGGTDTTGTQA
ncbi:MAG TPA: flagellar hook capping FlgD N-terminal domain-containing protein [Mobilitalea sp.]|nr:flagellar hook capping FlgD N-terminal domain-containing protein [Mobilitalea sp.]